MLGLLGGLPKLRGPPGAVENSSTLQNPMVLGTLLSQLCPDTLPDTGETIKSAF